jgi:tol-pal system protein YbgF
MRSLALTAFVCLAGCGDPLLRAQVTDLQKRLDESSRRQAQTASKLEQLEDRVFLLTDQVESQKVAAAHAASPRLPVVTLRPQSEEPAVQTSVSADGDEVEYRGEAATANPDKARTPFYHLDGSRHEPVAPTTRKTSAPVTVPESHDNLGVAPAPDVAKVRHSAAPLADAGDPLKLYKDSYEQLRAGRHDDAAKGFREFVRRFPHHDYADNAQYWLGECFYDRKMYGQAAGEFKKVVVDYPLGNKAPDALLKLGYALLAMGDAHKGKELLGQVPQSYPHTEAARLAQERLKELGMEASK